MVPTAYGLNAMKQPDYCPDNLDETKDCLTCGEPPRGTCRAKITTQRIFSKGDGATDSPTTRTEPPVRAYINCPKHSGEQFVSVDMRNGKTKQVCKLCVAELPDWIGPLFPSKP